MSGIRARRWRSRARRGAEGGDWRWGGLGEGSALRTRPQNGHTRTPLAAKREHSGLFLGAGNLQSPTESPIQFLPLLPARRRGFAPFPSVSFDGGHFPPTPLSSPPPPPPLPPRRLSSFLPLFLTQYTEMREAVVGFHFSLVVVCMRWDCESECVSCGQC